MSVKIFVEIGHVATVKSRPTAEGYTHDWELFVRGPDGADISHFVDKVVFNLHDSFPRPKRVFKEPPYRVKEAGYAGFMLPVEVYFKNRDDPKKALFNYDLDLTPVKSQREEYVFPNPSDEFRRKLLKGGGFPVAGGGAAGTGTGGSSSIASNDYKANRGHSGGDRSGTSQEKKSKSKSSTDDSKGQFVDLFGSPGYISHKPGSGGGSKVSPDPKQQQSAGSSAGGGSKTSPGGGGAPGSISNNSSASGKSQMSQKSSNDRNVSNSSNVSGSSASTSSSKEKDKSSSRHKHSSPNKESKKSSSSAGTVPVPSSGMVEEKHSKDKKDKTHSKERDKANGKEKNSTSNSAAGGGVSVLTSSSVASVKRPVTASPKRNNITPGVSSNSNGSVSNNSNNPTVPTSGTSSNSASAPGGALGGGKGSDGKRSAGNAGGGNEKEKKSSKKDKKSYDKDKDRTDSSSVRKTEQKSGVSTGGAIFSKDTSKSAPGPVGSASKTNSSHHSTDGALGNKESTGSKSSSGVPTINAIANASGPPAVGFAKEKKGDTGSGATKSDQNTGPASSKVAEKTQDSKDREKDERRHKHKKKDKSKDKEKDRPSSGKDKKDRQKEKASGDHKAAATGSFSTPTRETNEGSATVPSKAKHASTSVDPTTKPPGHDRQQPTQGYGASGAQQKHHGVKTSTTPMTAALIGDISEGEHSDGSDTPDSRPPSTVANEKDSEASNSSIADLIGGNGPHHQQQQSQQQQPRSSSTTSTSTTGSTRRELAQNSSERHHHKWKKEKPPKAGGSSAATATPPPGPDAKDSASKESSKKRKRKTKDNELATEKAPKDGTVTEPSMATGRRSPSPPSPPASTGSLMEPPSKIPKKDDHLFDSGIGVDSANNNNIITKQSAVGTGGTVASGGGGDNGGSSWSSGTAGTVQGSGAAGTGASELNNSTSTANNTALTGDYMSELKDLQHKIMTLKDNNELQRVVEMIAATGCYEITKYTFDFDLCALDRLTVQRLQEFFTRT
ncbi:protein AF-9 [Anopheles bellator]|uniref:protein AF-9 n=1 Tax=Anopheles bellator TaxID=139047 RepID=UPI002649982F|nr:protein AF-9 [Anopheles bellator]